MDDSLALLQRLIGIFDNILDVDDALALLQCFVGIFNILDMNDSLAFDDCATLHRKAVSVCGMLLVHERCRCEERRGTRKRTMSPAGAAATATIKVKTAATTWAFIFETGEDSVDC